MSQYPPSRERALIAIVLGPLFLVAFLYEAIGLAQAWIVKQFFWVPHRFRHGMLVAGAFGNVGDLRMLFTAVLNAWVGY